MFLRDGGAAIGGRTEKQRPWAWLRLCYGSWPRITALTVWRGVWRDLIERGILVSIAKGEGREKDEGREREMNQEYKSSAGGKICLPASLSFFKKRFKSRKSLVRTSSFSTASQLSCNDMISIASRSFCSGVNFSIHFSLLKFEELVGPVNVEKAETVLTELGA